MDSYIEIFASGGSTSWTLSDGTRRMAPVVNWTALETEYGVLYTQDSPKRNNLACAMLGMDIYGDCFLKVNGAMFSTVIDLIRSCEGALRQK